MDDLISRQAAIDALCDEYCDGWQDCKHYPKCENLKAIQQLPSADVRENVKGSLINPYMEEYYGEWYHCSVCGASMQSGKFCNECGAELKGEEQCP